MEQLSTTRSLSWSPPSATLSIFAFVNRVHVFLEVLPSLGWAGSVGFPWFLGLPSGEVLLFHYFFEAVPTCLLVCACLLTCLSTWSVFCLPLLLYLPSCLLACTCPCACLLTCHFSWKKAAMTSDCTPLLLELLTQQPWSLLRLAFHLG